jgi:hypothetical protein
MRMKSNSDFVQNHLKLNPDELSLKPLKAQVGGHVYMKILNDHYVCKPLNERELQFYQNIPTKLADHVPAFQGTLVVGNEESTGSRRYKMLTKRNLLFYLFDFLQGRSIIIKRFE